MLTIAKFITFNTDSFLENLILITIDWLVFAFAWFICIRIINCKRKPAPESDVRILENVEILSVTKPKNGLCKTTVKHENGNKEQVFTRESFHTKNLIDGKPHNIKIVCNPNDSLQPLKTEK